jgi:hypothetical protein
LARLLGTGIAKNWKDLCNRDLNRALERTEGNFAGVKDLIIDEISVCSGDQLEMVDLLLREALGKDHPFGDIRIVASGDFHQLPPVHSYREATPPVYKWAFQYPIFREFVPFQLCQSMRQKNPDDFTLLNELREGIFSDRAQRFVQEALGRPVPNAVALHPRNDVVNQINKQRLDTLPGPAREYATDYSSNQARAVLEKSLPMTSPVELKVGAPVVVLINNPDYGYYNGTQGEILSMDVREVVIRTTKGTTVRVERHEWKIDLDPANPNAGSVSAWGMPLKLGWALTIHRCQGLTLSRVETDVSQCWEPGHGYVALSRPEDLSQLSLLAPFHRVLVDQEALAYTRSI